MSKTLKRLWDRNPDKVTDAYVDSDGAWIHLKRGWQFAPHTQCHIVHEDTVREAVRAFREIVPCNCEDCATNPNGWWPTASHGGSQGVKK